MNAIFQYCTAVYPNTQIHCRFPRPVARSYCFPVKQHTHAQARPLFLFNLKSSKLFPLFTIPTRAPAVPLFPRISFIIYLLQTLGYLHNNTALHVLHSPTLLSITLVNNILKPNPSADPQQIPLTPHEPTHKRARATGHRAVLVRNTPGHGARSALGQACPRALAWSGAWGCGDSTLTRAISGMTWQAGDGGFGGEGLGEGY